MYHWLNGISKIDPALGDYIVLVDYGVEGLSVFAQEMTFTDAMDALCKHATGCPATVVKLVHIQEEP